VVIYDGAKLMLNHTVYHEEVKCLSQSTLDIYVNDDDYDQCFTRDNMSSPIDAPFNLLTECCDKPESCIKAGHRFSIYVFELSETKLFEQVPLLRIGLKAIPWLTRQYENL